MNHPRGFGTLSLVVLFPLLWCYTVGETYVNIRKNFAVCLTSIPQRPDSRVTRSAEYRAKWPWLWILCGDRHCHIDQEAVYWQLGAMVKITFLPELQWVLNDKIHAKHESVHNTYFLSLTS